MDKDFKDLCRTRQSVRAFIKEKAVEEETLRYIQECVNLAPTACNRQPCRFILVRKDEELALLQSCYPRDWFSSAPLCIIACRDTEREWVRPFNGKPHGDIDTAICVEHLCLAAAEKGLGTCWICHFDAARCSKLFQLPPNLIPVALVPMGYAADTTLREKVRRPLSDTWEER